MSYVKEVLESLKNSVNAAIAAITSNYAPNMEEVEEISQYLLDCNLVEDRKLWISLALLTAHSRSPELPKSFARITELVFSLVDFNHRIIAGGVSGLIRDVFSAHFDSVPDETLNTIFKNSAAFSNALNHHIGYLGVDPIEPDFGRMGYIPDNPGPRPTINQMLLGLIRYHFEDGLEVIDTEGTIAGGYAENEFDRLCGSITRLKMNSCHFGMMTGDAVLISDLLHLMSETLKQETRADRASLIAHAIDHLVQMSVSPVDKRLSAPKSIFLKDTSRKSRFSGNEVVFDWLRDNAASERTGYPMADRAIGEFYHHLLLHLAVANKKLSNDLSVEPLPVVAGAFAYQCQDILNSKSALMKISPELRTQIIESIDDDSIRQMLLKHNPRSRRRTLEQDLGL